MKLKNMFNKCAKLAKPLANDLKTSIPRCYSMIFNQYSDGKDSGKFITSLDKIGAGAFTSIYVLLGSTVGMLGAFTAAVVSGADPSSNVVNIAFLLGMGGGAPSLTPLFMKAHSGYYNYANKLFRLPHTKIEDEALPAFNKALRDMKPK